MHRLKLQWHVCFTSMVLMCATYITSCSLQKHLYIHRTAALLEYTVLTHGARCTQCCAHQAHVHVQLHTSRQLAVIIVHTHPWVPCKHHLLEELARQQQQAPVAQILESAETDSIKHSADWEEIVTYLQTITPENLHQYVPLGRSQSPGQSRSG